MIETKEITDFLATDSFWHAAIGIALLIFGLIKGRASFILERVAWMANRAPALPISAARPGDDCWIRGQVASDSQLRIPHFDQSAVLYWYYKDAAREDSHGNTSYAPIASKFNVLPFWIDADGLKLRVRSEEVFEIQPLHLMAHTTNHRHRASYLGIGDFINVLGVVSDDGKTIGAQGLIPHVITTKNPGAYGNDASERAKSFLVYSVIALWIGFAMLSPLLLAVVGIVPIESGQAVLLSSMKGFIVLSFPIFVLWIVFVHNSFVLLRTRIENANHLIGIDLLQRKELIPKLMITVKEYCSHESRLLERLTELRIQLSQKYDPLVEEQVNQVEKHFVSLKESYPHLAASEQFQMLANEITTLENKIAYDREFYNDNIAVLNQKIRSFPDGLIGRFSGIRAMSFLGE